MKRHLCSKCKSAVEPQNIRGTEFMFTNDFIRKPFGQHIGRIYVATSPEAAQPGQDEPSGQCPTCHGPTFCAMTGAV